MFEHRGHPLLPRRAFFRRQVAYTGLAFVIIVGSLAVGTAGYRHFEQMAWVDALFNASMILTGMGPASELHTAGGKLFVSAYALFSGVVFLVTAGVLFAPVVHRILHRFHLDLDEKS